MMKSKIFLLIAAPLLIGQLCQASSITCAAQGIELSFSTSTQGLNDPTLTNVSYKNQSAGQQLSSVEISADQTDREAAYLDVWSFRIDDASGSVSFVIPRDALRVATPPPFTANVGHLSNLQNSIELSCTAI